jgi:hypothetical protein
MMTHFDVCKRHTGVTDAETFDIFCHVPLHHGAPHLLQGMVQELGLLPWKPQLESGMGGAGEDAEGAVQRMEFPRLCSKMEDSKFKA